MYTKKAQSHHDKKAVARKQIKLKELKTTGSFNKVVGGGRPGEGGNGGNAGLLFGNGGNGGLF